MARRPRPVNPADGPVQAFAHDLRLVREQAGNPTYRVLAQRAGFAATTLSDAARGIRLPSLEVTQAYIGACGGDVEAWTRRWNELHRLAAAPAPEEPAEAAPAAGEKPAEAAPAAEEEPGEGQPAVEGATEAGGPGVAPAPAAPAAVVPLVPPAVAPVASEVAALSPVRPHGRPPTETLHSGRRPPRRTAVGTAVLLVLAAVLAVVAARATDVGRSRNVARNTPAPTGSATNAGPGSGGPGGCPVAAADSPPGLFSGTTYNGTTRLRAGASRSAAVVLQVPAGCRLQLTGFCLGDVVVDTTSGSPDLRWFRVATGGYVSSAVIHGNPPAVLQPVDCPDAAPPPTSIALAVAPRADRPGRYELRATGDHLGIVGYAAYLPRGRGTTPQWQQIGMSADAAAGFLVAWQPGPPADGADAQAAVWTVAVACFGGDGPSTVADQRLVSFAATGALPVAELDEDQLARAQRTACRYPDTNQG
ncbi:helix-turn-helix domain-containing protein [Kitasatospora griseola]|uniref:helix-turn-helix domain-containing protein n=1 Tax=Kitasatospora griseola TaxID=2064 RepID=UPI00380F78FD